MRPAIKRRRVPARAAQDRARACSPIWTEPGGGVLAEHIHPKLEERYEILEGEVTFRLNRETRRAGPGERLVVPAGVRHSFQNTGQGIAHLVVEANPALQLRESIEDGAKLFRTEKFTPGGKPRALRALIEAAALAHRYRETVILTSPPPALQRLLFPLLARFATSNTQPAPARASQPNPQPSPADPKPCEYRGM